MAQYLPITLSGETLGQRQRYINSLVDQAATDLVSFQDIENVPEQTAVDRLFKIDLAIKLKNVDYILKNLKDDDMLYVSRALKCKWLLKRRDVINPKYLEDVLFPEMVMPAISKMKHWLYINLRDPLMSQEFYQYYKDTKIDFAMKFLSHCNSEFVMNEFPKILIKISPHYLKVFGEKYPKLVKIFFDSLTDIQCDNELVKKYQNDKEKFYDSIKCLLKTEPDIFLDITEKYHSLDSSDKLSQSATDYILRFHKSRLMAKPELYVVYLLHMPTVAKCLSVEECQDIVLKLARADYLSWWFSYENVEPLIKRVKRDERAAFKKRVFVEKNVGERVAEWTYMRPPASIYNSSSSGELHVFDDQEYQPIKMQPYCNMSEGMSLREMECCMEECFDDEVMLCSAPMNATERMGHFKSFCPGKSELQKLFDEFRYVGFEGTFQKLKERVGSVKSADRRRDMLLVLVSKSAGRTDSVRALLQLALRLRNEPVHERASVVRSLVKRANAWRLPQDVWDMMLEYAHGLGLDGSKAEAECKEGLHAVVLRQLLATGDCEPRVGTAFLEDFSALSEYKLITSERVAVAAGLQRILMRAAAGAAPDVAVNRLGQLFDVLENYHIPFASSQAVPIVAALAERDLEVARSLLERLYEARVGRRELFRQYLKIRHDDAALLNALRHDPDAITPEWLVKLLTDGETKANQYLLKLGVYYSEVGGIAEQIRRTLQDKIVQKPDVKLARPLATLAGSDLRSIWREQDVAGANHYKLAAALRANMHRARPAPDALTLGWHDVGMKALATQAMRCRPSQVTQLVRTLLQKRVKRTVRLALILAQRTDCAADLFSIAVTIRPLGTLRAALLYFREHGDATDSRIWDTVKSLISSVDLTSREGLRHILRKVEWVPKTIKPDYCALLYLALNKISDRKADEVLIDLMKCLPEVSEDLLESVMIRVLENFEKESYPAIVIRYLMLSKSTDQQKSRFDKIGEPLLTKLYDFHVKNNTSRRRYFVQNIEQMISSLQYNFVFFDVTYQCCLPIIERVITWMQNFIPREMYFKEYVIIHSTMLYYKAVRQSIKHKPEVFEDPVKKISEGMDIVGFAFGRYIAKELAELKSKYFDSVDELYQKGFEEYLEQYLMYSRRRERFITAIIKGILMESVGSGARLAIQLLECQYSLEDSSREEIIDLILKSNVKEMQFFLHASTFD